MSRILGLDYGTKRIGVAVSDPLNIIAQGVRVVPNSTEGLNEIKRLAREYDVEKVVVGIPYNLKGEKGQKAKEVDGFIERIKQESGLEFVTWDERFTSERAHQTLLEMGAKKKQRQSKEKIDEMAAALILQGYLDSRKC